MKAALLSLLAVALLAAFALTRDGDTITPEGSGTIEVDGVEYEAFPLPDYAARHATPDTRSYFIEVEPGIKVHMLEVGSGFPLFLMHGNPTSGFLYRKVAQALPTDRVRVLMPTLVGLGFSSKVPASQHTLDNHIRWIQTALESLNLKEVVYAGQDWGGPVGMGALARSPGLLKGAVVLNTLFTAPTEDVDLSAGHATVRPPLVGELLLEGALSIFERLPAMQGDPASIPPDVVALYATPVESSGNAKAPLAMMRMVSDSPDHPTSRPMRAIERYVSSLDVPVEIIWGTNDPILAKNLPTMRQLFPDAPVLETESGHFLQEEVPAEIAAALMRVVDLVNAPAPISAPDERAATSGAR